MVDRDGIRESSEQGIGSVVRERQCQKTVQMTRKGIELGRNIPAGKVTHREIRGEEKESRANLRIRT